MSVGEVAFWFPSLSLPEFRLAAVTSCGFPNGDGGVRFCFRELLCGTCVLLTCVLVSGWEAVWEQQQAPESWFCGVLIQLAGRPVESHVGLRAQASCADDRPEGD